jgi:gamma-glutamylaminecyclotransferase
MCLIIHNPLGVAVDPDIIESALCDNPDGFGIFYHDDGSVVRTMSFSTPSELMSGGRPYTAHFRYSTSGKTGKKQCHPFWIDSRYLLMQNGTVERLRSEKHVDTAVLAELLGTVPKKYWATVLSTHNCRFAICDTHTGAVEIVNEDLWHKHDDDCLYSKPDVLLDLYAAPATKNPHYGRGPDTWEEEWETGMRGTHGPVLSCYEEEEEEEPLGEGNGNLHPVAVYGTLKQGHGNHERHLSDSYYTGSGSTKDKLPLVISGLPYLFKKPGVGHHVEVEVYQVTDAVLRALDGLEGHPNWYRRESTTIELDSGGSIEAWVYFMTDDSYLGPKTKLHVSY